VISEVWPLELMGTGLGGFVLSWVAVAVVAVGLVWVGVCVIAYIVNVLRGDRL
jgi:hypothetical protein